MTNPDPEKINNEMEASPDLTTKEGVPDAGEDNLSLTSSENKDVEVSPIRVPQLNIEQAQKMNRGLDFAEKQLGFIRGIPITITAVLGEVPMNIEEIPALGPGSLIHLEREISEPIDLLVNEKLVAKGEIVALDNYFGVRISSIIDPSEP